MSRHLSFRSGNPALSANIFKNLPKDQSNQTMTLDGAVNKTTISLLILMVCAYYTYTNQITDYVFIGFIGGFIIAILTIFKKNLSPKGP